MYLSYEDYQTMGGTLEETAFKVIEAEAEYIVDWYTFSRLKHTTDYPSELTMCMFLLMRYIERKNELIFPTKDSNGNITVVGKDIASQANDGVSISYVTLAASNLLTTCDTEMEKIVRRALDDARDALGRKLLYRGVYPDE